MRRPQIARNNYLTASAFGNIDRPSCVRWGIYYCGAQGSFARRGEYSRAMPHLGSWPEETAGIYLPCRLCESSTPDQRHAFCRPADGAIRSMTIRGTSRSHSPTTDASSYSEREHAAAPAAESSGAPAGTQASGALRRLLQMRRRRSQSNAPVEQGPLRARRAICGYIRPCSIRTHVPYGCSSHPG